MVPIKKVASKKKKPVINIQSDKIKNIIKKGMPALIAVIAVIAVMLGIRMFFLNFSYFKIQPPVKIVTNPDVKGDLGIGNSEAIKMCEGKSIFQVNIKELADTIKRDYPEFKSVKVRRGMPNSLEIYIELRIPVAVIKSFGYYPMDDTGVVLSPDIKISKALPVITGISVWTRPKIGERMTSINVRYGLELVRAINDVKILNYEAQRIDVANPRNVLLFLDNGLEIRLGEKDFDKKLKKLNTILMDAKIDKNNLQYIDMRFKDVVLAPR